MAETPRNGAARVHRTPKISDKAARKGLREHARRYSRGFVRCIAWLGRFREMPEKNLQKLQNSCCAHVTKGYIKRMKETKSPFKIQYNTEVLSDEVTAKAPADLIIALFAISMVFGLDRTESAIIATYPKASAAKIIGGMNLALQMMRA